MSDSHAAIHRDRLIRRAACTECGHAPLDHLPAGCEMPSDQLACPRCGGMFELATFARPVVHLDYTYRGVRALGCHDPDVDDRLVIGRSVDAAIQLTDATVARNQCAVMSSGGVFIFIKLGGSQPSCLNDQLFDVGESAAIQTGDRIGVMLGDRSWLWLEVSIVDG